MTMWFQPSRSVQNLAIQTSSIKEFSARGIWILLTNTCGSFSEDINSISTGASGYTGNVGLCCHIVNCFGSDREIFPSMADHRELYAMESPCSMSLYVS